MGAGIGMAVAMAVAYVHQTSLLASILTFGAAADAASIAIADRSNALLPRV
jgi:hypothetical protein